MQFTDVVVAVDGTPVADSVDYLVAVGKLPTGSTAMLKVRRRGGFINLPVVIGPRLEAPAAPVVAVTKPARTKSTPLLDMQTSTVSADYAKAVGPSAGHLVRADAGGQQQEAEGEAGHGRTSPL